MIELLSSERIYLRLMEEKDVPYKVEWINNPEFRHTLNFDYPLSEIGTRKWLQDVAGNSTRKDYIVCDEETDTPIRYGGLIEIDYKNSKAESYMVICNLKYQCKDLVYEIREVILNY